MSSEQPAEQTVRLSKRTALMLLLLFCVALWGFRERAILKNGTDATATIIALRDTRDRVNEDAHQNEGLQPSN